MILRQRLRAVMRPDLHANKGLYRVTSLYFDNIYRSAYFDKTNGTLNRKKFRIRIYDLGKDVINLEEKVKNDNVGYKKSSRLTLDEYGEIMAGNFAFLGEERFAEGAGGDFYASSSAAMLSPAVIVDYIREPYVCAAGNVRITFDMKIAACTNGLDLFDENNIYETVMPDNDIVLEVKYDSFIPEYILQMLTGISTAQESVSKFILCSDKLLNRSLEA